MFSVAFTLFLLLPGLSLCTAHQNLSSRYSFNATLRQDYYQLYWSFNQTTISFAVKVRTTGWVGLGISPNGSASGSDVAVGWIDDSGNSNFYVRGCSNVF